MRTLALRGAGAYVGDVVSLDGGAGDSPGWTFTARAAGPVRTKFVPFDKFFELTAMRPEIEADGRAGDTLNS